MNKLFTVLIILFLVSGHLLAQTLTLPVTHDNWKWLSPVPFGGNFSCVEYASENNILAGGYNGYGLIYYSQDGGTTWAEANVPREVTQTVTKIKMFSDGLTGYAMAGDHFLKTTDGGLNWQTYVFDSPLFFYTPEKYDDFQIYSTYEKFERLQNGILLACKPSNWEKGHQGKVSFDEGKTWNLIGDSIRNVWGENIDYFRTLYFSDSLNGWGINYVVNEGFKLYHTADKGKSWEVRSQQVLSQQESVIYFKNADEGYFVEPVSTPDSSYHALKYTSNGGLSWATQATFPSGDFFAKCIAFVSDSIGLFSNGYQLYKTIDKGQSWNLLDSVDKAYYNSSTKLDGIGFDITENNTIVIKKNSSVYYSYDKGHTWTQPHSINFPGDMYNTLPHVNRLQFVTTDYCIFSEGSKLVSFNGGRSFFPIESSLASSTHLFPMPAYSFATDRKRYYFNIDTIHAQTHKLVDFSTGATDSTLNLGDSYTYIEENKDDMYFLFTREYGNYKAGGSVIMKQSVHQEKLEQFNYPYYAMGSMLDFPLMAYNHMVYRLHRKGWHNEEEAFNGYISSLDKNHVGFDNQLFRLNNYDTYPAGNTTPGFVNSHQYQYQTLWTVGEGIYRQHSNSWENLGSPGSMLNDISFVSATNGTIVGNNIEIYSTINSGNFWTKSYKPEIKVAGVTGAYFTDDDTGYLISSNTLYHTHDGGFTWGITASASFGENNKLFVQPDNTFAYVLSKGGSLNKVNVATGQVASSAAGVKDFYFLDSATGYYISEQEFFRTDDGGDTWKQVYTFFDVTLNAVSFSDTMHGYAGGNLGKLYKTTNGGISWADISVAGKNINGLSVVSADTVFVGADQGQFFYSFDGGLTFTPRDIGTYDNIHHIRFFNGEEGYIVSSQGYIKLTRDEVSLYKAPIKNNDPRKFERFEVGNERKSSSLFVINNSFNDFIYANNFNILRNPDYVPSATGVDTGEGGGETGGGDGDGSTGGGDGDGTVTSVPDEHAQSVTFSVYPNPNTGKFAIAISIPNQKTGYGNLKIYNAVGMMMYEKNLRLQHKMVQEVDLSQLKKGIYTMTLQVDDEQFINRIIVR